MHPTMISILKQMVKDPSKTTADTARLAMTELLEGRATPAQIAAYLVGLKLNGKEYEPEIIAASADVMRQHALTIPLDNEQVRQGLVDIVGTGGDGHNTFNVSTASAIVAAGAGCFVAKHGNRASSSSSGSADVLEALGCALDNVVPDTVPELLRKSRFVFLFAQTYHPAMKNVAGSRREIGVPTIFNLLGPLSNPAMPKRMIVGVHSKFLGPLMAKALVLLGVEKGFVVCGAEGLDEISPQGDTNVWSFENGEIKEMTIHPRDFGLPTYKLSEVCGGDPAENADLMRRLLSDKLEGPIRDFVLLNSGALLVVAGKAQDFKQGVHLAKQALADGSALKALETFAQETKNMASGFM